jgi:superfamily II DNA or RNA helicase
VLPDPSAPSSGGITATAPQDARRVLMDTIRDLSLGCFFSRAALKAAEPAALPRHFWPGPLAWFRPDGSQTEALQCEMIERLDLPRLVSVYLYSLFGQVMLESSCTCGESRCVHAAALIIRLQKCLDWPRPMTPLQRWQRRLETITDTASTPDPQEAREQRQLVCLLRTDSGRPHSTLLARLVVIEGPGGLLEPERWLLAEDPEASPYLSREGLLWQAQLARCPRDPSGSGHRLKGPDGAMLTRELLDAGICHHARTQRKIHRGAPRAPQWQWSQDLEGGARVGLQFRDDDSIELIDLDGLYYLDEASGELGPLQLSRRVWWMLEQMPSIPPGESALRREWPPHPSLALIPPPPAAPALRELRAPLQPILVIGASRHSQRGDFVFHLRTWADYGGCRLPLAQEAWQSLIVRRYSGEFVGVQRDIEGELRAQQALAAADIVALAKLLPEAWRTLAPPPDAQALAQRDHFQGSGETFTALETTLQSLLQAHFQLEHDPDLPFAVLPPETPLQATLVPDKRPGWTQFQLTARLGEEQVNVLPLVLRGLKRRAFSLTAAINEPPNAVWLAPLGSQRFLPLPLSRVREWLAPLIEHLQRPQPDDERPIPLSPSQTMALSECLQRQRIAVEGGQPVNVAETLARLRAAQSAALPVAGPISFHGSLRRYQCEGLRWLQALRQSQLGGVLADDMGLGKTVQVIAHLLLEFECGRLDRPALLLAPTSLVFNWMDEIARFAPTLPCLNFTGPARAARRTELRTARVIITTYALLVNDLPYLEDIDYSMLVLDEAQWLKNPLTQAARAVRRLRASHRVAVTGTPLENHLGELWTHMDAVMPGYLGDYGTFNRSFRIPIERQDDDARMRILRHRIAPFMLRRNKAAVAPELPPKTETVLRVSMDEKQRDLYESLRLALSEEVRAALATYSVERSRIVVLSALLRLRQVCCDPRLIAGIRNPPASAKLAAFLELIRSLRAEGRQVLVFSQFTSMLELIAQALDAEHFEHVMLTGSTGDRATPVRRFQKREITILLASLKAGGVGLNLTAADAVIQYDPWWNPAVERQAVDRAHRLGREQPIFVYKLLCEETIEEKIEAMKSDKSDLAHALLGDAQAPLLRLSDVAVRALFDLTAAGRPRSECGLS